MPKQRFGLGRGLDALIPGATAVSDDTPLDTGLANSAVFAIPVAAITPNPTQPRMPMSEDPELIELATSIREHGLLQPVLVTLAEDDAQYGSRYYLIAGERRWRAAQIAGLQEIPAVVREATPQMMLELALVENLQRSDLNPLEEARGYQMLMEEYGLTQEQVAASVGRNRATVANTMRLLQLPDEVREALITMPKVFTEGHARAVLQINGDAERILAAKQIIAQQMSVRAAEELARRFNEAALRLTPDRRGARVRQQSYETRALEEEFTRAIEMKARLARSTRGKGSLTLYFTNDDQLQRLYERIVGPDGQLAGANGNGDGSAFASLLGYARGGPADELLDDEYLADDDADESDDEL
ncbi:MAG TPA: ParB/RepB/Spo0J family partition protein [Ktedonobacterales bacterium]|nr:ParB/RepB/Spo0J family partition protein [Ktedonobacterales bacterium]